MAIDVQRLSRPWKLFALKRAEGRASRPCVCLVFIAALLCGGCHSVRETSVPVGPHLRVLTYNVNWGAPDVSAAIEIVRHSKADIVCLQETTPVWERAIRRGLRSEYPYTEFRESAGRTGGGLAFLSKSPGREVAYVCSDTGWFDGWLKSFETAAGPVQIINVHLRPPVSDGGGWASGYFTTRDDRVREMERFWNQRQSGLATLVVGDFNDGENSRVLRWLRERDMKNALPDFDRDTPTWQWRTSVGTLSRRMDHIVYSPELTCHSARVLRAGGSDHFPVEAVFTQSRRPSAK